MCKFKFRLRGTTKDHLVANVIHLVIKDHQMFTHHHVAQMEEVAEVYCQAHGFNDDNHWIVSLT